MRIYPVNQSPIMFRGTGSQNKQHSTLKRYCEPKTGAYYYYNPEQIQREKSQIGISKIFKNIANKFNSMSKALSDTFTPSNINNSDNDDILWL